MATERPETRLAEDSLSAPGAVAVARRIGAGTRKAGNWVQLVKFGLVGGSGYVFNLAVFAVLNQNFGAGAGPARFEAARFFAVSLGSLFINLVILQLLVMAELPELQAQAIAVAVAMPFNFIGNKLWTFS